MVRVYPRMFQKIKCYLANIFPPAKALFPLQTPKLQYTLRLTFLGQFVSPGVLHIPYLIASYVGYAYFPPTIQLFHSSILLRGEFRQSGLLKTTFAGSFLSYMDSFPHFPQNPSK